MSILFKGFKMPEACLGGGCPIGHGYCNLWWDVDEGERHRDCPLIELPDHGDLIDRDAIKVGLWGEDEYKMLCDSPVVIPAERE